jgi:hypothetical protein
MKVTHVVIRCNVNDTTLGYSHLSVSEENPSIVPVPAVPVSSK